MICMGKVLEGVGGPAGPGNGRILTRDPGRFGGERGLPSQVVGWGQGRGGIVGLDPTGGVS